MPSSPMLPSTASSPALTLLTGGFLPLPDTASGERLDRFLAGLLKAEGVSREKIKEWIKAGCVFLDDVACRTPRQTLAPGQRLQLCNLPETTPTACPPAIDREDALRILHADADILVLDKPAGLTVHPAPSCKEETLVHRLLARYPDLAAMGTERPGIVHRIDKDTSGLLVVARHEKARQTLAAAFEHRQVDKAYLAICHGVPETASGRIEAPIGRHPTRKTCMAVVPKGGRPAVTDYQILQADPAGRFALVLVTIHTGRTHQIRVHMRHIGHPLLGDGLYGGQTRRPGDTATMRQSAARRQMLHAWRTAFAHPVSGQRLAFLSPLPREMLGTLLRLQRQCQRVIVTGLPGSGKSAVAGELARQGVPVFSADACVAGLYAPGGDGAAMLQRRYGERFFSEDGHLDRHALFEAMRTEPGLRQEVEAMIHPMVKARLAAFWDEHAGRPLAAAEIPLAVEAGWDAGIPGETMADLLIGVHCSRGERHARLAAQRGWSAEQTAVMDAWQWDEAAKLNRCQLIVDNTAPLAALPGRVRALRRVLAGLRAAHTRRQRRVIASLLHSS
ncbi:dephospho-CoA kinase [Megalodesulfovibrio paquesii]